MAIAQEGYELQSVGGATGSWGLTVPANTDFAVVYVSGWADDPNWMTETAPTLGGIGADGYIAGDTSNSYAMGAAFYWLNPSTGSQNFVYDWGDAPQDGNIYFAVYYSGVDTASPLRDTDAQQAGSVPATKTLTAQTGDAISVFAWVWYGSNVSFGWTNATEISEIDRYDNIDGAIAEAFPSGNISITPTPDVGDDGGVIALVLKPLGGGGGGISIPIVMAHYRRLRS